MVRMEGKKGLFLVKRVDAGQGVADLLQRAGNRDVIEAGVAFALIRAVPRKASKVIQQFLGSNHGKDKAGPADPMVMN